VQGAVDRVRGLLATSPAALLVERMDCDVKLRPIRARRWLATCRELCSFQLAEKREMRAYLSRVVSFGGLFSYVSCILARRDAWEAAKPRDALWGTHYAHVGRILDFLQQPLSTLVYVPMPLVLCRGDNDSFIQNGLVRRFFIDIAASLRRYFN